MDEKSQEAGLIFVVGAAETRGHHQNSVFLRWAAKLRRSGGIGAPVFGQCASRLSVGRHQPHQPGVAEPRQVRPWIGAMSGYITGGPTTVGLNLAPFGPGFDCWIFELGCHEIWQPNVTER